MTRIKRSMLLCAALASAAASLSASGGPGYSLSVLVDGAAVPEYAARNRVYVEALKGKEFVLRIANPTGRRVAVALSVDGRNVIDAKRTGSQDAAKWVLSPWETIDVPGWQVSGATARRFFFTETSKSYAKWLGDTANVGTIEAVFYRERERERPQPTTAMEGCPRGSREPGGRVGPRRRSRRKRVAAVAGIVGTTRRSPNPTPSRRPASATRPSFPSSGSPSRPSPRRPHGSRSATSSGPSSSVSACCREKTSFTPATARVASSTSTHPIRTGADPGGRIRSGAGPRGGEGRIEAPLRRRQSPLTEPERTDEELLHSAREGDEDAFGAFVRRHTATVHRWMARAVGESDADDMTQDVFLKAYRGLPRFRGEAPPRAWLASIADNAVKNRYRSRSRFRRIFAGSTDARPDLDPPETSAGPEDDARAGESRRRRGRGAAPARPGVPDAGRPPRPGGMELRRDRRFPRAAGRHREVADRPRPRTAQGDTHSASGWKVPMIETLSHPAQSAEFLSRRHDGELAADEAAAFEAHRLECAECPASVAEFEDALAAYRSAPVTPHASDLSARILRKIRATSPSRRPFGVMFGIDVRWAGALAAALLVVIIGAPVFSRREMRAPETAAERPASAPIPAYVLDAEEERPSEKSAELRSRSSPERPPASAPKAEAAPPARAADDSAAARDVSGFASEGAREEDSRRDELAATRQCQQARPDPGHGAGARRAGSAAASVAARGRPGARRDERAREEQYRPSPERFRPGRRRSGRGRLGRRNARRREADDPSGRRRGRAARRRPDAFGRTAGGLPGTKVPSRRRERRPRRRGVGAAGGRQARQGQGARSGRADRGAHPVAGGHGSAGARLPARRSPATARRRHQ